MRIKEQHHGAVLLLRPDGPLAGDDAAAFLRTASAAAARSHGRVALDAAEVSYVDSAGLESLLDLSERLAETGQGLKMFGVNETLREVFALTEVGGFFECYADANDAVRSFMA